MVGEATVPAYGQAVTTVALSPLPTGTIAAGTVVILIASVSDTSGPVLNGNVTFLDGTKTIGTVSVVQNANANYVPGTATLRRIFGPGGHNIRAVYDGSLSEQISSSSTNTLTVASGGATQSASLVYGTTRYFNQLTRLEGFVLTDINNDGVLDLVAPQFGMSNIAISLGDAAHPGSFLPPTFVSTSTSTVGSVAVGDLNGDGLPDIVFGDADNNDAGILLQDPSHPGTFLSPKFVGATQSKPLIADMNHDGIPDLVLFPGGQSSAVAVLLGDPHNPGSFLAPTTTSLGRSDLRSVATADMNGDGLPDVVIGNYTAQTVSVLLNDPAHPGNLLPKVDYPAGGSMFDLAIGDLNGDGNPDVVLGSLFSGVTILLGNTVNPGQLLTPHSYPVTATPAGGRSLGVAIGDIDGDGIPDVVSGNYGPSFDLLLGNGDGTLRAATAYATGPTPDTFEAGSMAVGDVDGDGLTDVVVGQFYQNSVQIFPHQPSLPSLAITATDISLSATVVRVGDPLTITIKVSSFNEPPTGSIALYDSSGSAAYSPIATLVLDSTGTATYTTSTLQQGFHDFVAYFAGGSLYAPSTSLADNVVVNNLPTVTMTLRGAPNPGTLGQNVALTATIAFTSPAPTGSVAFLDSGTVIGIVPLTAGAAVLNTSSLIIGAHTIQASYSGDSNYVSQQATVSEVIRYPPAVLTLSSSLNPESFGQSVTFTAKATATGPSPTGSVIFQDNGKQAGQVTLAADGTAAFATSSLNAGSHVIQAIYSGDSKYDSQSATLTEVVAPAPTLATLSVSPNPATAGQIVTFKALVTGGGTPSGNVAFFDGTTSIGSASLDGTGTAVLNTTTLQVGTHPLTAIFAANSNWGASSSAVVNEVIIPNPRDYTLTYNGPLSLRTEHHGSTVVTATPIGGLSDTVSITCGPLPIYVTCQVVPSQVSISNGAPQNVTVKIDTDAVPGYASMDRYQRVVVAVLLPCLFFGLPRERRKLRLGMISLCLLAVLMSGTIGCSGKYPSSTPPGTYSIVINGHGESSGLDRTTILTLIVTPKETQ